MSEKPTLLQITKTIIVLKKKINSSESHCGLIKSACKECRIQKIHCYGSLGKKHPYQRQKEEEVKQED